MEWAAFKDKWLSVHLQRSQYAPALVKFERKQIKEKRGYVHEEGVRSQRWVGLLMARTV